MIYLDNAATSGKKPQMVINAVNKALTERSANPGRGGHNLSVLASEEVFSARSKVAKFFGANGEDRVIFTPSCTYALNFAIKGVMRRGEHIIISSMEHNAAARPTETIKRLGAEVDIAEVIFGDKEATVRSFKRLIRPNTRAILLMHASNVTGEIFPIEALGELCAEKGILFIVDAAQTAGVIPIDMQKMHIDFLAVAPHKGLYAPMGTGILIANKDISFTIIEGGTGVASLLSTQPLDYPERFESGTVNLPGIMGISAGIDFVNQKGMDKIYSAELSLIKYLYNALTKISGVELYTPFPKENEFVPLLSFNIRNADSSTVSEMLNDMGIAVRGGLHCSPFAHKRLGTISGGTVRVSPGIFNSRADIEKLILAVKKIAGKF